MLKEKLEQDLKAAMLAKNTPLVSALKMLKSAILYKEVELNVRDSGLTDDQVLDVLNKEAKKRRESIEMYRQGGRAQLAESEAEELKVIETYLPKQMSNEELEAMVTSVITELGANGMQDMGKVIGAVKAKVGNSADGSRVASFVKAKLV